MSEHEKTDNAGLIGPTIPDVDGTEPRLTSESPEDCYDEPSDDEACDRCWGEGCYHDCGDDSCCCADPETDDLVMCEDCNGTGVVR